MLFEGWVIVDAEDSANVGVEGLAVAVADLLVVAVDLVAATALGSVIVSVPDSVIVSSLDSAIVYVELGCVLAEVVGSVTAATD